MTAQEMFEKLNYIVSDKERYLLYWNEEESKEICLYYNNKTLTIDAYEITMEELKAIYKMCQEKGVLDEEEKH